VSALPCIGREELFQPSGELIAMGRLHPLQSKHVLEAWETAKALCGSCSRAEACLQAELAAMRAGARTMGVHGGTTPPERAAIVDPTVEVRDGRRRRQPQPVRHGEVAGYAAHRRRGEQPCDECRAAVAAYNAAYQAKRRGAKGARTA